MVELTTMTDNDIITVSVPVMDILQVTTNYMLSQSPTTILKKWLHFMLVISTWGNNLSAITSSQMSSTTSLACKHKMNNIATHLKFL